MSGSERDAIARMGTALGPGVLAACLGLFDAEQSALAARIPARAVDCRYGPDQRNRLDLYGGVDTCCPVVLFVHGGGFVQGDKGSSGWPNAAVGRMAAERGWLGAVMNYRLAPVHGWPAGGRDVLAAVDWLTAHAAALGGDPARIVLLGTSAGSVHVATALKLRPDLAVRGCVMLSGLYGYTPLEERDLLYFGDPGLFPQRMPRDAVAETALPLFLAAAEFDPPRFQAEFLGLMQERLARHGVLPRSYIAGGHNHYSMAMHLGIGDHRLADEIGRFIADCCA